jgi:esterase/lipase
MKPRIEALLSARLFLVPQLVGDRLYFLSNLGGHISLYGMDYGGSVPEPLLPPHIALQNPHLIGGYSFAAYPDLEKILVMIDQDGDENYQPMMIPMEGGFPEPLFEKQMGNYRVHLTHRDIEKNIAYFNAESRQEQRYIAFQAKLKEGELIEMGESHWGNFVDGVSEDHSKVVLAESYTIGDHVLYLWEQGKKQPSVLYGTPIDQREEGQEIPLNAIYASEFTAGGGLLFSTALFVDHYGLGYFDLQNPEKVVPVPVNGIVHEGEGELEELEKLNGNRYLLKYNIDGCSWLYEGNFNEEILEVDLSSVVCGQGDLSLGVLESVYYDKPKDRFALSFSIATSPTQIFTVEGENRMQIIRHTSERVLGIPEEWLSSGEDASYTTYDDLRISARLYLPAEGLGFEAPFPLVYYVHGGPQGQERPDFSWFSMPLIQYLTLNGMAVFVPNVRGSTGYGLNFTKQVDKDWGGRDRLDHVYAMREVLPGDERLDVTRSGVVGRSYGGYMTLTLAGRHPELWSAAVDMFGPYDLVTFSQRIPETWKPYFSLVLGDPEIPEEREFLIERSPRTYIDEISAPLLVIQGKNDPRVVEIESRELVEHLRAEGKEVEYLMFEDEGHDVLKFDNRVRCYNAITDFFVKHLRQKT